MSFSCLKSSVVSHFVNNEIPGDSEVKNRHAVQETRVQSLGWEDPLGKGNDYQLHGQRSLAGYIQSMGS